MRVVDVRHRDVYFLMDLSLTNIKHLKMLLDRASITFDGEQEPEMIEAEKYLHEEFYPLLKEIIETPSKAVKNGAKAVKNG